MNDVSRVNWIQDNASLVDAVESIGSGPVAVDLEADSFHHYYEKVCLVQMSVGKTDYLVDPLAGLDMGAFKPLLENRAIRKILHGADYDLRLLDRDFHLEIAGIFDTQIAARLTGERAFGLAALLGKHCGCKLDKRFQRADWSRRPLPEDMLAYAVEDTRHLRELASIMESRIEELGRAEWMYEEFRYLEAVRWNSKGVDDDPDPYLRVKGSNKLDRRSLTILRELFNFRDRIAKMKDVPLFRVMRDAVLIELARQQPLRPRALGRVPGLPRSYSRGRGAAGILEAIEAGRAGELVPAPKRNRRSRPNGVKPAKYRKLRDAMDSVAGDLDIEPTLLGSRKLLEGILGMIETDEEWREAPGLRNWQAELLVPILDRL